MNWLLIALLPYTVTFLVIWFRLLQEKKEIKYTGPGHGHILLSLVIPFRDEGHNITSLLKDISRQNLDPEYYEVIFVDDGSTDTTRAILDSTALSLPGMKILDAGGRGKKEAMALGLEHARGDFIVSTDADCRLDKDWLQQIFNCLVNDDPDMIIGAVDIIDTGSLMNRFVQLEFLGLQAITEFFARKGRPVMCNAANLCFRHPGPEKYRSMVRLNIPSGDDMFLMEAYRKEGKTITWLDAPGSIVKTHFPSSFRSLIKQRIRWTSKSPYYSDPGIMTIAALVFLTCLLTGITFIGSFIVPDMLQLWLVMLVLKSIPDLLLLIRMTGRRNKKGLLFLFLPLQLMYPFYVVYTGLAGIIRGLFSLPRDK
ncbi:MAG: glycosyltransferase [Bacteroidales bacterium]|nr:glycosyltransferase [Bacteroidales bacterium]